MAGNGVESEPSLFSRRESEDMLGWKLVRQQGSFVVVEIYWPGKRFGKGEIIYDGLSGGLETVETRCIIFPSSAPVPEEEYQ